MDAAQPEYELECFSPPEKKPKLATNSNSDRVDDESSDDDDALYNDGLRKMTKEEERRYANQVRESGGFDVDDFRHIFAFGLILPINSLDHEYEILKTFAELAIDRYNLIENAKLELVRVLKANCLVSRGLYYYITFEAKDAAGGQSKEYQAKVCQGFEERSVNFCRLKPTKQGD